MSPSPVPNPDAVDTAAVAKELPYGTVTVTAVKGGMDILSESGGDAIIIANAAVIVSLHPTGSERGGRLARLRNLPKNKFAVAANGADYCVP